MLFRSILAGALFPLKLWICSRERMASRAPRTVLPRKILPANVPRFCRRFQSLEDPEQGLGFQVADSKADVSMVYPFKLPLHKVSIPRTKMLLPAYRNETINI